MLTPSLFFFFFSLVFFPLPKGPALRLPNFPCTCRYPKRSSAPGRRTSCIVAASLPPTYRRPSHCSSLLRREEIFFSLFSFFPFSWQPYCSRAFGGGGFCLVLSTANGPCFPLRFTQTATGQMAHSQPLSTVSCRAQVIGAQAPARR
ncbi:hypothetical protein V8C35DRAFT_62434 [Trichoderma chlorosporum]